jgi:hypothetical protein
MAHRVNASYEVQATMNRGCVAAHFLRTVTARQQQQLHMYSAYILNDLRWTHSWMCTHSSAIHS